MNDDFSSESRRSLAPPSDEPTLGMSALYKLFEAFINLRAKNAQEHKMFEQVLTRARDEIKSSFNSFAADTQRAYQSLRQEVHGEKRVSLALLNELLDLGIDLEHIVAARPKVTLEGEAGEEMARWADAIEVECRKVQDALRKHGIQPYDAVVGSPYNPALHERVGSKRVEGIDGLRVAEQREHGWASQQPEFILRRPKILVSE
jgi:molecular chaperone GrpE (heat shock protein)